MATTYDVTLRINESGIHVCRLATVRHDFSPGELRYNTPFESISVPLSKGERAMVYKFRSRYPVDSEFACGRRP